MIKSSIEKLAKDIGFDIVMSDDQTQANLLNGLSKSMCNSMNDNDFEMQCCYIVEKLDNKSHHLIKRLASFIQLKEQEPNK